MSYRSALSHAQARYAQLVPVPERAADVARAPELPPGQLVARSELNAQSAGIALREVPAWWPADWQVPRTEAEAMELLYEEIKECARLTVLEQTPKLEARIIEKAIATVNDRVRGLESKIRALEPTAPRPWLPDRSYVQGETCTAGGGCWTCIAIRGATAGEVPGPHSPVWSLTADGVADVEAALRGTNLTLTIRLAGGSRHDVAVALPLPTWNGTWDARKRYEGNAVVSRDGGSFLALRDDPGPCPGPGWMMMAARGKTGLPMSLAQREQFIDEMKGWFVTQYAPQEPRTRIAHEVERLWLQLAPPLGVGFGAWNGGKACQKLEQLSEIVISVVTTVLGSRASATEQRRWGHAVAQAGVEAVAAHVHEVQERRWYHELDTLFEGVRKNLPNVIGSEEVRQKILDDLGGRDDLHPQARMWCAWVRKIQEDAG